MNDTSVRSIPQFGDLYMLNSSLRWGRYSAYDRPASVTILEIRRQGKKLNKNPRTDWVLVEKREELDIDRRTVQRARLSIYYWDLGNNEAIDDRPSGEFEASYDKMLNVVSLTTSSLSGGGYVRIDPPSLRGTGLGTYLMNQVVLWVRQWPEADVREISLAAGDAADRDNRSRRNHFYERFGIHFDYVDADQAVGTSKPMIVRDLRPVPSWADSIIEHGPVDYMRNLITGNDEAKCEVRFLERDNEELRQRLAAAYRRPIRWMLARLLLDNLMRTLFCVCLSIVVIIALIRVG